MSLDKPISILIIGSGGREHALAWKLAQSPFCKNIYCVPGNGGTALMEKVQNVVIDSLDFLTIEKLCADEKIDLVIVGPEAPLADGIVDVLQTKGLRIFGPRREEARLEWSKQHAKNVLQRLNMPTAKFAVATSMDEAEKIIRENSWARVIKVDGLAAGKGVIVCDDESEAIKAVRTLCESNLFTEAGQALVIEEKLNGEELSFLTLCDGKDLVPLMASQDHKRRFDDDAGPNTGGMGAYAPVELFAKHKQSIERDVLQPLQKALKNGDLEFRGVLFIGLMIADKPYVLEFNTRFGDPETQTILPLMASDLLPALWACTEGTLKDVSIKWTNDSSCCVCLVAENYPAQSSKGELIEIKQGQEKAIVFHAGTCIDNNKLVTNGGRVLNVVGVAPAMREAIEVAYKGIESVKFAGMSYRKDIARRASACRSV